MSFISFITTSCTASGSVRIIASFYWLRNCNFWFCFFTFYSFCFFSLKEITPIIQSFRYLWIRFSNSVKERKIFIKLLKLFCIAWLLIDFDMVHLMVLLNSGRTFLVIKTAHILVEGIPWKTEKSFWTGLTK